MEWGVLLSSSPEGTEMKKGEKYSGGEEKGVLSLLGWSDITREQASHALLPFSTSLWI